MTSPGEMAKRIARFPEKYMDNFDYVWKQKIRTEANPSESILGENNREKFYNLLCTILPKWQTYRNGSTESPVVAARRVKLPTAVFLDLDDPGQHHRDREADDKQNGKQPVAPIRSVELLEQEIEDLRSQPGARNVGTTELQHASPYQFGDESG